MTLVITGFKPRYIQMERGNRSFLQRFLLTKVWMPLILAISLIINLLELWFHLILKINLFLSFHIATSYPLYPKSLTINLHCSIDDLKGEPLIGLVSILPSNIVLAVHVIVVDLNIIENGNLHKFLTKVQNTMSQSPYIGNTTSHYLWNM